MRKDIEEWVLTCQDCQRKKGKRETKIGLLHPIIANFPFEIIAFDIVGPLNPTKRGNNYILVMEDYHTKWPEAFPLPDQEARTIAHVIVEQVICRYGAPRVLLTDRRRNFQSHLIEEILLLLGIKQRATTAYHPQCDGLVERFNRTLLERLAFYVNNTHDNWDDLIPYALFAYRTARHESTQFSPYFLLFHREAHLPTDIALRPSEKQKSTDQIFKSIDETFRQVQHNAKQAQERQERNYNLKRKPHNYSTGDIIWLFNPVTKEGLSKKFIFRWIGPYKIKSIYSNDTLDIESLSGPPSIQHVHVSRTKPCYQKALHQPQRKYEYEYYIP